ncbi:MAG: hypothetical protein U0232_01610 [Thermomicrobiales bacterium]
MSMANQASPASTPASAAISSGTAWAGSTLVASNRVQLGQGEVARADAAPARVADHRPGDIGDQAALLHGGAGDQLFADGEAREDGRAEEDVISASPAAGAMSRRRAGAGRNPRSPSR